ncbi:MAG TPA: TolC family protein [Bacteroidota bacterium]|nr:TolC family protein [Bacteroidota bacterium]
MRRIFLTWWGVLLVAAPWVRAQNDTTRIALPDAEERFVRGNLQLLAARLNIDAARAAVLQAQLWSNPNIQIEQNVYNPQTRRYMDFTKEGNTEVQVQQLFLLAGKRDKQVKLAEINTRITEQTLYELLRALRLELRSDFFDLYFLQQSVAFYDESLKILRNTIGSVERIYEKRSILLAEVLRLKALLFSLENERLGLVSQMEEIQGGMRILLRDSTHATYVPQLARAHLDSIRVDTLSLDRLIALAKAQRPDYQMADATVRFEETNLALQRALAIPDVTLGGRYSRNGSYIPDYFAVTVSVDIPIFNRNQGNILVSERTLEVDKANRELVERTLEKEVTVAFRRAVVTDGLYRTFDRKFAAEYQSLVDGMVANYLKRNMTIIEFTDFYESYRTAMLQMNQLQDDRADAFESLYYALGSDRISQDH